jgi:flagellar biogenesis protein FliO
MQESPSHLVLLNAVAMTTRPNTSVIVIQGANLRKVLAVTPHHIITTPSIPSQPIRLSASDEVACSPASGFR